MIEDDFLIGILRSTREITRAKREKRLANQQTYLMKDENTGYTKIGVSINPKLRERTLQSQKPTIVLYATVKGNIERKLQKTYSDKKVRGEWFNLTEEDINSIITKYSFITK